jgi:hypothetical protein
LEKIAAFLQSRSGNTMRLSESPQTLKQFRRTAWEFQMTFETSKKELAPFVNSVASALPRLQRAFVVIEGAVFEPRYRLAELYERHHFPPHAYGGGTAMEAENPTEARELLHAILSEWIDFLFIPTPKPFVIFADHDQYATFAAHRKSGLTAVAQAMSAAKIRQVDYIRTF